MTYLEGRSLKYLPFINKNKLWGGGGFDDVEEEIDVSEENFLVSEANIFVSEANILVSEESKLSIGARILGAHRALKF